MTTDPRGPVLCGLARAAIAADLGGPPVALPDPLPDWLAAPGATFVTLRLDDALRGCIGTLEARLPLHQDVRDNARSAAFADPRFPPLGHDEQAGLAVEISLLTPPERLDVRSEADARAILVPGRDGVVLRHGGRRATFLPQVWDQLPDPAAFLARLKEKAGLAASFWHPDLALERYRVEKLTEE